MLLREPKLEPERFAEPDDEPPFDLPEAPLPPEAPVLDEPAFEEVRLPPALAFFADDLPLAEDDLPLPPDEPRLDDDLADDDLPSDRDDELPLDLDELPPERAPLDPDDFFGELPRDDDVPRFDDDPPFEEEDLFFEEVDPLFEPDEREPPLFADRLFDEPDLDDEPDLELLDEPDPVEPDDLLPPLLPDDEVLLGMMFSLS